MNFKNTVLIIFSLIVFTLLPVNNTFAEEALFCSNIESASYISGGSADNESLFADYANSVFYPEKNISLFGTLAYNQLNDAEKSIYDVLKPKIFNAAEGKLDYAVFETGLSSLNIKNTWSAKEMGAAVITNYNVSEIANAAFAEFVKQFDYSKIVNALLNDCPYELYWYDKTAGSKYAVAVGADYKSVSFVSMTFVFQIADGYHAENYDVSKPEFDTSKISLVKTSADNAKKIAEKYSALSDFEKLTAYRDEICALVSYNYDAASDLSTPFSDPWQLIYVFDGNESTNVVCEGYSKAFQYLCDISNFEHNIACCSIGGLMNGGGHMWNIVSMDDGKNYLVDLTNSDTEMIGQNGGLFLAGADSGSIAEGYCICISSVNIVYSYCYDNGTSPAIDLWGSGSDSILYLSGSDYTPAIDIDILPQFSDSVTIDFKGDDTYKISLKDSAELSAIRLCRAVYTASGELKNFEIVTYHPQNGETLLTVSRPNFDKGETFKITLWTNKAVPIIKPIS